MTREDQVKFDKFVEDKIKEIDSTMALEGMSLSSEFKETLRKCFYGITTTEIERKKIIEKYKKKYG